jgi:hypothetical protein
MQVPSLNRFVDTSIFAQVTYSDAATVMVNVFQFTYFAFHPSKALVVAKRPPPVEPSFQFGYRTMRKRSSLYQFESDWLDVDDPVPGAYCCWLAFPRDSPKRKRGETDTRAAERAAFRNSSPRATPLELTMAGGEVRNFNILSIHFASNSATASKVGFAILKERV